MLPTLRTWKFGSTQASAINKGRDLALRDGPAPMYYGSGYIGKGDFWKFGLIFGVIYFAGLLLIVMPWLRVV